MEGQPRRSSRLAGAHQHKRQQSSPEVQPEHFSKRACKTQLAHLLRAGSAESARTQFGGSCPPAAAPATAAFAVPAAAAYDASPASDVSDAEGALLTPGIIGTSQEHDETPLGAALLLHHVSGNAVPAGATLTQAAGASGAAVVHAASAHPALQERCQQPTRPTQQQQQQQQEKQQRRQMSVPASFLAELAAANQSLLSLHLPGSQPFCPVHPSCALLPLFCVYGLSPAAVSLGASYFQRLMAQNNQLFALADHHGFFSSGPNTAGQTEVVMHGRPGHDYLIAVYCTCAYLGLKVTDGVQCANQLSHMLSNAVGGPVHTDAATELEMKILKLLNWRLGPYTCRSCQMGPW